MGSLKTNAMRILDRHNVCYEVITYDCDEFVNAVKASKVSGVPLDSTYKTLVGQGKSERYCAIVLPADSEADLKKVAKVLGEKSVELIPVKEINNVTGYVRGGCSPLGIKRSCKVVIDSSVNEHERIFISGGRLGCTLCIKPGDLIMVSDAFVNDVIQDTVGD